MNNSKFLEKVMNKEGLSVECEQISEFVDNVNNIDELESQDTNNEMIWNKSITYNLFDHGNDNPLNKIINYLKTILNHKYFIIRHLQEKNYYLQQKITNSLWQKR